ncbi:hypothetical protein WH91_04310 [Devosia psychrophila]|uniref:Uncharacterized protein n=1 Tax=Devosia psychrophila TaxID=728005 RepID=A0ABR5E1S6_9HYPH|nr:hypothetical protein WH91_04310 [Devosia psychrophila]
MSASVTVDQYSVMRLCLSCAASIIWPVIQWGRGVIARLPREIDPKPVAATLIAPGHFRGHVPELLLHIAFVYLRRGSKAEL